MARLTQRTANKTKTDKKADIHEKRKKQAAKAKELARTIDEKAFIGTLNDEYHYIVLYENDKADEIQTLLNENNIETRKEYRVMFDDTVLYLQDEPETDPDEQED